MTDTPFHCGFVAIVGRPNVGKSTLMNHLIGQKISITSKKSQTTRHRVTGIHTEDAAQFVFVDTPGFQTYHKGALNEALNKSVKDSLGSVDCVLFLLEAMRFTAADREVMALLPKKTPVILVVNKLDKAKDKLTLQAFIDEVTAEFEFAGVEVVSAKHGQRLAELLDQVRPHLPESMPLYPEDMITDKNERFLAAEIVREKLFRYLGEELPYEMNVEVEMFEMDGALRRIHIAVLVDKEHQKPIVIGRGGEKLKKISTEARLDMEKLFDGKVFLQVWVKVKSGWADDVRFLREFGLD
ncbi:GTPase Era [Chromobacterium violaceum]|uniref:GTPase Era n=2 Tax=Chromobacterium violaceum TaxID=536 RepID=ERA_CHRVO|nr:GTPase Era [Chromobacterium violaceum]Q7NWC3.1 RecName: Full=GTPase Era [Chromobacterium violaceum ATCC 12472]AAQ59739.1 GTP-binding protein [Chromobacterium violaceum ATCC 12472]ATP28641.1 GTPase Era [Chromobacterium violaceum]ATP32550.1 GTPase Era [Chromobacterium violaceum]KJH66261.1 GTPase Era [Chromobacterium violaceum]KMN49092.1 GTPase Era [Chromobacterium violaceum]